MKIFFLGTGAAEGVPALFCRCAICAQAHKRGGKNKRTRSTVMINDCIKIDLPPDTLAHVHAYGDRLDLANMCSLLFTHSHDDHFAVRELQYLSPNFAPERKEPVCVWGTPSLLHIMQKEMAHFFEKAPLSFCPLTPFIMEEVGSVDVTPIIAHHKQDELCLNFLLRDRENGKTLLYASDTGWYDDPTWEFLADQKIDGAVIECGKGISTNTYPGHLNLREVIAVKARLEETNSLVPGAPVYLTHICHTGGLCHEEMEAMCAPYGLRVAWDGLEFSL